VLSSSWVVVGPVWEAGFKGCFWGVRANWLLGPDGNGLPGAGVAKPLNPERACDMSVRGRHTILEYVGVVAQNKYYGYYIGSTPRPRIVLIVNNKIIQKAIKHSNENNPWVTMLDVRFLGEKKLTGTRTQVLRSHAARARHEYAHWLIDTRMTYDDLSFALRDIWRPMQRTIEENMAKQLAGKAAADVQWFTGLCAVNHDEMLAEASAAYHSPLYVKGTLPKQLESFIAKVSKRLRLKP